MRCKQVLNGLQARAWAGHRHLAAGHNPMSPCDLEHVAFGSLTNKACADWVACSSYRGGMGNIMEGTHGHGEGSKNGQLGGGVHGVLHRIKALDLARLTHMEHEYRSAHFFLFLWR